MDRGDAGLVASVYHADGTDDHGSFKGLGSDFAVYATSRLPARYRATQHTIANTIIDFVDDDTAHVESHVCARHLRDDGDDVLAMETFFGRYVDRFERRDGEWRIARRTVVHDWSRQLAAAPESLGLPLDGFAQGSRDGSDPVFSG